MEEVKEFNVYQAKNKLEHLLEMVENGVAVIINRSGLKYKIDLVEKPIPFKEKFPDGIKSDDEKAWDAEKE